ncbi:hypothetical protein Glove_243g70 [Diversispora epigaea]|uniref:Uncharacterized protein n=1 Tax=Diversispora epigaea TaxID=1348612 RepID=A0A397IES7_9GLOM|nr:hypothetical protein Glove_243g70 [Diversispora epigaea]
MIKVKKIDFFKQEALKTQSKFRSLLLAAILKYRGDNAFHKLEGEINTVTYFDIDAVRQINETIEESKFSLVDCIRGREYLFSIWVKRCKNVLKWEETNGIIKKMKRSKGRSINIKPPEYIEIKNNLELFKETLIQRTINNIYNYVSDEEDFLHVFFCKEEALKTQSKFRSLLLAAILKYRGDNAFHKLEGEINTVTYFDIDAVRQINETIEESKFSLVDCIRGREYLFSIWVKRCKNVLKWEETNGIIKKMKRISDEEDFLHVFFCKEEALKTQSKFRSLLLAAILKYRGDNAFHKLEGEINTVTYFDIDAVRQINETIEESKFSLVDCIRGLFPMKLKTLLNENIKDLGNRKKIINE